MNTRWYRDYEVRYDVEKAAEGSSINAWTGYFNVRYRKSLEWKSFTVPLNAVTESNARYKCFQYARVEVDLLCGPEKYGMGLEAA